MSTAIYVTRDDLAALAWAMAVPGASQTETKLIMPHVRAGVDVAVKMLSQEVWESAFDRQRIMKDFTINLSGTTGGAIGALDSSLIIESISPDFGGSVYSSAFEALGYTGYLDWADTFQDASSPHDFIGIGTYTVRGFDGIAGRIYCFDETGAGNRFNGTSVIVKGAIHYDFATVPEQLKHRVVAILVQIAREKLAGITNVRQNITSGGGQQPNG